MGQGLPFRPGCFDGAISISALQWLCYEDSKAHSAKARLMRFFSSLYTVLRRGARAALQFYPGRFWSYLSSLPPSLADSNPSKRDVCSHFHAFLFFILNHSSLLLSFPFLSPENSAQVLLITEAATRVGFQGGLVVDYPNSSKAKKYYLCLSFEHTYRVPRALTQEGGGGRAMTSVGVTERERMKQRGRKGKKGGKREAVKSRDWVLAKKEKQRSRGLDVREDSKYTARKRKDKL